MQVIDLGGGYAAHPVSVGEYRRACERLEGQIFGGNWLYDFGPSDKEPPALGEAFTFNLYFEDELIGWHHSHQLDERTVYMADTGILPEHQGRGLYKRLLPHLLKLFKAVGYTLVQSHHRATNNRVIVPKLRAGFVIQGLNLYEGGLNVKLEFSLDKAYRDAQHVRSGLMQAQGETARRLGVTPEKKVRSKLQRGSLPAPNNTAQDIHLGDGYFMHRVPFEQYQEVYSQLEDDAYDSVSFDWKAPAPLPAPTFQRYAWLISHLDDVIGWHYSRQWDNRVAYMVNTAFLPPHRSRGLYTRLLPVILHALRAEGYVLVRSHHHATNNAVIVPKLRAGFRLQGLQVDDHGVMAVLNYSFDDVYRDYMDVRSGLKRPAGEVARRIRLKD